MTPTGQKQPSTTNVQRRTEIQEFSTVVIGATKKQGNRQGHALPAAPFTSASPSRHAHPQSPKSPQSRGQIAEFNGYLPSGALTLKSCTGLGAAYEWGDLDSQGSLLGLYCNTLSFIRTELAFVLDNRYDRCLGCGGLLGGGESIRRATPCYGETVLIQGIPRMLRHQRCHTALSRRLAPRKSSRQVPPPIK